MAFIYSLHAIEQMKLRGLNKSIVDDVLKSPGKVIIETGGVNIYQKIVPEKDKPYLYRVFVNREKKPPLVITAYKTSKTDRYENQI